MKATLSAQLGQQLHLTPALLQSIRLLQLNGMQLELEVRQALESNPLLELHEEREDSVADTPAEQAQTDTAAFDELMKEAAQGDIADPDVPSQRERLLSGPSGPGVPKTLGRETWWFYTACQAHQCGTHQLAMLYQPEQTRLVGRLLSRCKVWWLGNPSAEQRELIDDTAPVDASLLRSDGSTCDDEL